MDSGLSIGASIGVSASTLRTDIGIARPAATPPVATVLPPTQAVEATGQSNAVHNEARPEAFTPPVDGASLVVQKLSFDENTHILVYSDVDRTTGYVVDQFPDKLVLRQKAYVRQLLDKVQTAGGGTIA